MIADEVGGDLHLIEIVTPYMTDFDELWDVNHNGMEQNFNFSVPDLVFHPIRNQTRELPVLHHCVVEISRRCHRIAVEISPGTGTNHAAHKSNF